MKNVATSLTFLICFYIQAIALAHAADDVYASKWYDWGLEGIIPRHRFQSVALRPPRLSFPYWDEQCDDGGYITISPRGIMVSHPGPVMLDTKGTLVWMSDKFGQTTDFKVQEYRGKQYLTFWAGRNGAERSYGVGLYYMLDSSYEIYKTLTAVGGLMKGDLHEFKISRENTALITVYERIPADLSILGGPRNGWVLDSLFQEIDIESGELLFEWRASENYALDETMAPFVGGSRMDNAFDFFHINSVDKNEAGNYIISSRYMQSVTCISPAGDILWIIGGKRNMFQDVGDGHATDFMWQHHARLHDNHTMTIFDNGKCEKCDEHEAYSRAMTLFLDPKDFTVYTVAEYIHPTHSVLSQSQGSAQLLENGNVLIGWGFLPAYTEFTPDGEILCDAHFAPSMIWSYGWETSYRTFKSKGWKGEPKKLPDVAVVGGKLYVSWNGATEVRRWILEGADWDGVKTQQFSQIETKEKLDFETSFKIKSHLPQYFRVAAVNDRNEVIIYSGLVDRAAPQRSWVKYLIALGIIFLLVLLVCFLRRRRRRPFRVGLAGQAWFSICGKARPGPKVYELSPLYSD